MGKIVLHRLTDWPVFRHVRPLLEALEVDPATLAYWQFYSTDHAATRELVDAAPEHDERAQDTEALLAVSRALAELDRVVAGAAEGDEIHVAYHDSAPVEVLEAAAKNGGHAIVFASSFVGHHEPTPDYLVALLDEWQARSLRSLAKHAPKGSSKAVLRYIDEGCERPLLPPVDDLEIALYRYPSSWSGRDGRILDVFVASTGGRSCPTWSQSGEAGPATADAAGVLRDALTERGVPDGVIFEALCASTDSNAAARGYGHPKWASRAYLLASFYARLDEVAAMGPGKAATLFATQSDLPEGLRMLTCMVADRWCRRGGFDKLDLAGLAACTHLRWHHESDDLGRDAALVHRERILARRDASLAELIRITEDIRETGALPAADAKRFQAALKPALDREDATLVQWERARHLKLVDQATFAKGVMAPFRRAVAAGFRSESGYGDQEGFMAAAKDVAAADPDLCLRGWAALTLRFNEYGLRDYAAKWDGVVPTSGFSKAAIAEVSAAFSSPNQRSAAKILKKLLAARKIEIVPPAPPQLESVDATFEVGTDVAHLIVGSWSGVEAVASVEDPDDWPAAMKKQKCIGLETGGDGSYTVRVKGVAPGTDAKKVAPKARHLATFPLGVADDTLTVSGIVGAGGTPTIPFPSGTYVADVLRSADGVVVVVVAAADKAPKWTFKSDLPHL